MHNKNIIWLASYPKSGNTWVRIFLNHILGYGNEDKHIGRLEEIPIASNRKIIDQYLGVASSDLSDAMIRDIRPKVYREISRESKNLKVLKVHDAFCNDSSGEPIFPPEITKLVVYIIRNPLDVAVSYAHHSGASFETTIKRMNDSSFTLSPNTVSLSAQVPQFLGSWSDHVRSWLDQNKIPVHLMRYEDLLDAPEDNFNILLDKLNIKTDRSNFILALKQSDFKNLKAEENKYGFMEKPIHADSFFREGKAGNYKKYLNQKQINRLIKDHKDVMLKFGY